MKRLRIKQQHDILGEPCGWIISVVASEESTPLLEVESLTRAMELAREKRTELRTNSTEVEL
jgi:hypothetical protein